VLEQPRTSPNKALLLGILTLVGIPLLFAVFIFKPEPDSAPTQNFPIHDSQGLSAPPASSTDRANEWAIALDVTKSIGVNTKLTERSFTWQTRLTYSQLQTFQPLSRKPLPREDEIQTLRNLYADRDMWLLIKDILSSPQSYSDPLAESDANTAVDFLLAAMEATKSILSHDPGYAQSVSDLSRPIVIALLQDPALTAMGIPVPERQARAGLAGELLYHASAKFPEQYTDLEKTLTTSTAQRIWQNVQDLQERNRQEFAQISK
jgi:hypothetical protein